MHCGLSTSLAIQWLPGDGLHCGTKTFESFVFQQLGICPTPRLSSQSWHDVNILDGQPFSHSKDSASNVGPFDGKMARSGRNEVMLRLSSRRPYDGKAYEICRIRGKDSGKNVLTFRLSFNNSFSHLTPSSHHRHPRKLRLYSVQA